MDNRNRNRNVQRHSEEEASYYGFSKDVTKRSSKAKRKMKKLNHLKLRLIFGTVAAILGVIIGLAIFGVWYKEYLLNQITY